MSGNDELKPGDHVGWNWGRSHIEGVVSEVVPGHLEKEIKGKTITRNGDEENPAVFVTREGPGNPVVKKASELHKMGEDEDVPSNEHVDTPASRK